MSKTLEVLFNKASEKGESNKNGRMSYDYGYVGDLEEQWHVVDKDNKFQLRHWGTVIFEEVNGLVTKVYGQGVSDRDALNQVFNYRKLDLHAHYYPSRDTLEVHDSLENIEYSI